MSERLLKCILCLLLYCIVFRWSVPDTFASRTAAKQDEYADAAIGNITGENFII